MPLIYACGTPHPQILLSFLEVAAVSQSISCNSVVSQVLTEINQLTRST